MHTIQAISFILTVMSNLFYIPVKLSSRQDHPWSFIPTSFGSFSAGYTQSAHAPAPMVDHPHNASL